MVIARVTLTSPKSYNAHLFAVPVRTQKKEWVLCWVICLKVID
jgi:hypothetical protein